MSWTDDFIGIQFAVGKSERSGLDCWGLARLVYREKLGIELPDHNKDFSGLDAESIRWAAKRIDEEKDKWTMTDNPLEYDLVLLKTSGGVPAHIGILNGAGGFLHIIHGVDSSVESLNSPRWRRRIEGFYRYAK